MGRPAVKWVRRMALALVCNHAVHPTESAFLALKLNPRLERTEVRFDGVQGEQARKRQTFSVGTRSSNIRVGTT